MTQYYCLIVAEGMIKSDTCFYKISAGSNPKHVKDLMKLQDYAYCHNYYLRKWDYGVTDFLHNIADSLGVHFLELNIQHVSVSQLMSYIRTYGHTPDKPALSKNMLHVLSVINPAKYFSLHFRVIHQAEAETRKKPKARKKRQ